MGPIELQVLREFAIACVRECAEGAQQATVDQAPDLLWYSEWFERRYDAWLMLPRTELDDRTPAEAIQDERCALNTGPDAAAPPQQLELYTDLPAEDHADQPRASDAALAENVGEGPPIPWLDREGGTLRADDEHGVGVPAVSDPRWDSFCARYLADWLDM